MLEKPATLSSALISEAQPAKQNSNPLLAVFDAQAWRVILVSHAL